MRYTKIKAEMIKAIYDFCMEQTESCEYTDSEIKAMINTAFEELKKFNCSCLPVSEIKRFELSVSSGYTKEILPPFEEKRGIIFGEVIRLASFTLDEYGSTDCPYMQIERGYDVVYDLRFEKVILLYRVDISDNDAATVYRVETDLFENFNAADFIIALSVQLANALQKNR